MAAGAGRSDSASRRLLGVGLVLLLVGSMNQCGEAGQSASTPSQYRDESLPLRQFQGNRGANAQLRRGSSVDPAAPSGTLSSRNSVTHEGLGVMDSSVDPAWGRRAEVQEKGPEDASRESQRTGEVISSAVVSDYWQDQNANSADDDKMYQPRSAAHVSEIASRSVPPPESSSHGEDDPRLATEWPLAAGYTQGVDDSREAAKNQYLPHQPRHNEPEEPSPHVGSVSSRTESDLDVDLDIDLPSLLLIKDRQATEDLLGAIQVIFRESHLDFQIVLQQYHAERITSPRKICLELSGGLHT